MDENFENFLKQALAGEFTAEEKEAPAPEPERTMSEDQLFSEGLKKTIGIMEMGAMVKLGKAAQKKLDETITNLINELNALDKKANKAMWQASSVVKITKAAEKITILNVILSATAISGTANIAGETDFDDVLNTIVRVNQM